MLHEDITQYDAAWWDFLPLSMHLINLVSQWIKTGRSRADTDSVVRKPNDYSVQFLLASFPFLLYLCQGMWIKWRNSFSLDSWIFTLLVLEFGLKIWGLIYRNAKHIIWNYRALNVRLSIWVDIFILPRYVNEEKDLKTKFTQKKCNVYINISCSDLTSVRCSKKQLM